MKIKPYYFECKNCGNVDPNESVCEKCPNALMWYKRRLRVAQSNNNVAVLYPHLQEETEEDLRVYTKESQVKILWVCKDCGKEWKSAITNRTVSGSGCPECGKKKIWKVRRANLPKERYLKYARPDIWAELVDKENNENLMVGSDKKVTWKCSKCGRVWDAFVYSRTGPMDAGCAACSHSESWKPGGVRFSQIDKSHFIEVARPDLYKELKYAEQGRENVTIGSQKKVTWECSQCGGTWEATPSNRCMKGGTGCPSCNPGGRSKGEILLGDILKVILQGEDVAAINNFRDFGMEYDYYIPEKKLCIEYNGIYFHSEQMGRDKNYHLSKRRLAESHGCRLVTIWEDVFEERQLQVIKLLMSVLGVSRVEKVNARDCSVAYIGEKEAKKFLNDNHIQGFKGGSRRVGLTLEGEIVAVATLTESNNWLTLERYATSKHVRGGLGKIVSHLERTYPWMDGIITYADLDISDGGMYRKVGFELDKELPPDYMYVRNSHREHKFNFRKKSFQNNPELLFQEGFTESELANLNGLLKCWDSGKLKYSYKF